MQKPTGKLMYAYKTISNMESKIESLEAELSKAREENKSLEFALDKTKQSKTNIWNHYKKRVSSMNDSLFKAITQINDVSNLLGDKDRELSKAREREKELVKWMRELFGERQVDYLSKDQDDYNLDLDLLDRGQKLLTPPTGGLMLQRYTIDYRSITTDNPNGEWVKADEAEAELSKAREQLLTEQLEKKWILFALVNNVTLETTEKITSFALKHRDEPIEFDVSKFTPTPPTGGDSA